MALTEIDPTIGTLLQNELERQSSTINLIPSENYPSAAVLEALGSILTAKYAEGYPGKRYYQGNAVVDEIERIGIARAKELFGAEHVNLQALSGVAANHAVYLALCQPGDVTLGIEVPSGGHLSHGEPVTFIGKYYRSVLYTVDRETEMIDYDAFSALAESAKPKIIWIGSSSYPRHYDYARLAEIAKRVGAYLAVDIAHVAGLVAADALPSPVPYADVVTFTTHKTLRGPRGAIILCRQELAQAIDRAVFPGLQGGPHQNNIAGIVVTLKEAASPEFQRYAEQVLHNAQALAGALLENGFDLVTGGTDNHLMVIKLASDVSGREAAELLERAGIVCNRQSIPFDKRSRFNPGGVRYGTPAMTTCGMREAEMKQIADWTREVLTARGAGDVAQRVCAEVRELRRRYPLPQSL